MLGRIFLSGEDLQIEYGMENVGLSAGVYYQLGHGLTDFLHQGISCLDDLFAKFIAFNILAPEYYGNDYNAYQEKLSNFIDEIDVSCAYLHFYIQALLRYMLDYFSGEDMAKEKLLDYISDIHQSNGLDFTYEITKNDYRRQYAEKFLNVMLMQKQTNEFKTNPARIPESIAEAYIAAKQLLLKDILCKQKKIQDELDFITSKEREMEEVDYNQRLYLLDYERIQKGYLPLYVNTRFITQFMPQPSVPKKLQSLQEIKSYMIHNKVKILPTYELDCFEDLIAFELFQIVDKGIIIKKCENCGYYFVPSGRSDTKYCDWIKPGNTKSCKEIGALKKYKRKKSPDRVYMAYNKAYKRNHSRERKKKMSQDEFYEWSEQARQLRDDCKKGKISLEDYQKWLDDKK